MGIPLQPLNIPQWILESQQASPVNQMMNLAQGMSQIHARNEGMRLQQQQLQQQLPLLQAKAQLAQAQAKALPQQIAQQRDALEQRIHVPSTGGLAGEYQTWLQLQHDYGPNSPIARDYKAKLDQQIANQTTLANARGQTANSFRGLSALGKHQIMSEGQRLGYSAADWAMKTPQERAQIVNQQIPFGGAPTNPQEAIQTQSGIIRRTTTADQQNRMNAANRALPLINEMVQYGPQALQYAGIGGNTRRVLANATNSKDPSYIAYRKYKQNQAALENDMALALGLRSTDKAFEQFKPLFNIDNLSTSPKVALQLLQHAKDVLHKEGLRNTQNLATAASTLRNPSSWQTSNVAPQQRIQQQVPIQAAQTYSQAPPVQAQPQLPTPNAPNNSYYVRVKSDPTKIKVVPASHIQQVLNSWGEVANVQQ